MVTAHLKLIKSDARKIPDFKKALIQSHIRLVITPCAVCYGILSHHVWSLHALSVIEACLQNQSLKLTVMDLEQIWLDWTGMSNMPAIPIDQSEGKLEPLPHCLHPSDLSDLGGGAWGLTGEGPLVMSTQNSLIVQSCLHQSVLHMKDALDPWQTPW